MNRITHSASDTVEIALRESERAYRTLVETSHDLIWSVNAEGRWTFVNASVRRIYGYEPTEMLGRLFTDFETPEQARKDMDAFAHIKSGTPYFNYETVHLRKDGTPVWLNFNAVVQRDDQGTVVGTTGTAQDISERKRSEQARDLLLSLTRATLESTADGILVVNSTGRIETFNRRFVEMWHLTDEVLAGGNDDRAIQCVLDQLSAPQKFIEKVRYLYGHPAKESFDTLEFKDGRVFERYSRPQVIEGQVVGRVWSFRDATERARAESVRSELEGQLRHAQKMEAVGRLAGGIAHDFNNILTAISGHASLLEARGRLSGGEAVSLEEILRATGRAANLTRQLLAFSRKQALRLRDVDLNRIVTGMTQMLARTLGEDVEIRTSCAPDAAVVRADESMMEQILLNLAVNARDAMPGGGWLSMTTECLEIDEERVRTQMGARPGRFVCLAVSDAGTGIAPSVLPHIFEPFFTTKDVGKGTGLGLATVYGIVQQHEGWITVQSEEGHGATFRVYFPLLATSLKTQSLPDPPASPARGGCETILLVEDEAMVRDMVRAVLEQQGYTVLEAATGEAGFALWLQRRDAIKILLTDMVMPGGMTGRELAAKLQERGSAIPVIYMSGYSADLSAGDFPLVEGTDFVSKPFNVIQLTQVVRSRLDAK